jgi:hypothetical protein
MTRVRCRICLAMLKWFARKSKDDPLAATQIYDAISRCRQETPR